MARNRGKKALYEVIGKGRLKPTSAGSAEPLHPEPEEERPVVENQDVQADVQPGEVTARIWKKPSILHINAGRIEFSLPYQYALALMLGLVVVVMFAYWLGQRSQPAGPVRPNPSRETPGNTRANPPVRDTGGVRPLASSTNPVNYTDRTGASAEPTGNNRIVIQTCRLRTHLEPVKQYFAQFRIQTEIRKISNMFYLVTSKKYDNPNKPGTDGYLAKQKIVELGAGYKAPAGYDSFAPKLFNDAFGMKFDD